MREFSGISCLIAVVLVGAAGTSAAEDAERRFDGVWDTVLSCPNASGALGFSFEFDSIVKAGVLHGEKGTKGEPGWLQIDGSILSEGSADLYASGLVGAARYAVGRRPAGTAYGYHISTKFSDSSGNGTRVEGRPCTVAFSKTGAAAGSATGPRAEVAAALKAMGDAANAHDVDGHVGYYAHTPDVTLIVNGEPYVGWDTIRKKQTEWWNNSRTDVVYQPQGAPDVSELAANVVLTTLLMKSHRTLAGGEVKESQFAVSSVWQKRPEGWKVVYSHESTTR